MAAALSAEEEEEPPRRVGASPFPPRGPGRPLLRQVRSEPWLRREPPLDEEACLPESREEWRSGLGELLVHLDRQHAARKREEAVKRERDIGYARMQEQYRRALEERDPPDWLTWAPSVLFDRTTTNLESGESAAMRTSSSSLALSKSRSLERETQARLEKGWRYRATNDRGLELDEFGAKARARMGPTERRFAERLDEQLSLIRERELGDRLSSSGRGKRAQLRGKAESSLNPGKEKLPPWSEQLKSTQVLFSAPAPDPPGLGSSVGLDHYLHQPDRTTSFENNFVAGLCDRTSFWQPPSPGKFTGSMKAHARARALLCPRGCKQLLEENGHQKLPRDDSHPAVVFQKLERERAGVTRHFSSSRSSL